MAASNGRTRSETSGAIGDGACSHRTHHRFHLGQAHVGRVVGLVRRPLDILDGACWRMVSTLFFGALPMNLPVPLGPW